MSKKIITVFGSTGSQGGSLVKALLKRPDEFTVRACTRNAKSEKARALEENGCEICEASYQDYDSLVKSMTGSYGAFFITSFWDQPEKTIAAEIAVGEAVGRAAKQCGVQHLIFSTLESPAAMGAGFEFPTFDAKVGVEQALKYIGVPMTAVQVAWYFNNLENNNPNPHAGWYKWPRDDTGAYVLEKPIGPNGLHGIHNLDVGEACATIFLRREEYVGRKVALSGELLTGESMIESFRSTFPNQRFVFKNISLDDFLEKSIALGWGDAIWRMYRWYQYRMPQGGDVVESKQLNSSLHNFAAYLRDRRDCFSFEHTPKDRVYQFFEALDNEPLDEVVHKLSTMITDDIEVIGADGTQYNGKDGLAQWFAGACKDLTADRCHTISCYEDTPPRGESGVTVVTLQAHFVARKSSGDNIDVNGNVTLHLRRNDSNNVFQVCKYQVTLL